MRRFVLLIFGIVVVFASLSAQYHTQAQSFNCEDVSATVNEQIEVSGLYKIWVHVKKEIADSTSYLSIDKNTCIQLTTPSNNDWVWVESTSGAIETELASGAHSFGFSVSKGNMLFDKILATNSLECIPNGDGTNCFEQPLEFYIDGITENQVLNSSKTVKTVFTSKPSDTVSVSYAINGNTVNQTSEPDYCLAWQENTCSTYDFTTLPVGNHLFEATATSSEQTMTIGVPFSVVSESTPIPEVPSTPPRSEQQDPEIPFIVEGISEGDNIQGVKKISASVTNLTGPISFRFSLNSTVLSNDYSPPYCAVGNEDCENWDSRSVVNGNYGLVVTAAAEGFRTTMKTVNFVVKNPVPSIVATSSQTPTTEVIVGRPKQQATGITRVTVPSQQITPGAKITYKLDNEVVAETNATNPSTAIDTTKYSNGVKPFTATITKPNGEQRVIAGSVNVKNDAITSSTNWFRENVFLLVFLIILSSAMLFFTIRLLFRKLSERKFELSHNVDDGYSYVLPQQAVPQQLTQGFAAIVIVFVGITALGKIGTIQAATGLGFIAEIEDGIGNFTIGEENGNIKFAKLSGTTTPATPPSTSSPVTNPSTPAPATNASWSDEFDGPLDLSKPGYSGKWSPNEFGGDGVGYEDFAGQSWNINPFQSPDDNPFSISDSILRITMKRTTPSLQSVTNEAWSGAYMITNPDIQSFTYGYFESRIRWPNPGVGMFPAFWLYDTNGGQREIDIMEIFGSPTGRPWTATIHHSNSQTNNSFDVDRDTTGWHTYALDWQPNYLRWYYDGEFVGEMTNTDASYFNTPMSIRLNFSMDAPWFWQKSDASTPNPMYMDVDYVRYWPTKPS